MKLGKIRFLGFLMTLRDGSKKVVKSPEGEMCYCDHLVDPKDVYPMKTDAGMMIIAGSKSFRERAEHFQKELKNKQIADIVYGYRYFIVYCGDGAAIEVHHEGLYMEWAKKQKNK